MFLINPALQNGSYDAWTEQRDISPAARDLLRGLLTEDPEARMTSAQVLGHPWLQQGLNKVWLDRHKAIVVQEVRSFAGLQCKAESCTSSSAGHLVHVAVLSAACCCEASNQQLSSFELRL